MAIERICTIYFSPTGNTEKIATALSNSLSQLLQVSCETIDFTVPANRSKCYEFDSDSLVILAVPVYAGRIPNKILPHLEGCIKGNGQTAIIPVCVYGNRSYDEALREMLFLAEDSGFIPIGAAAMVSRHAFSDNIGKGRPDSLDFQALTDFSRKIAEKITGIAGEFAAGIASGIAYDRSTPIGPYYTPLKADLTPARFLKAKPVTDTAKCLQCGTCAGKCPMGSISNENVAEVSGICIKCQACIRFCPVQAKSFTDTEFQSHVEMLKKTYTDRKEPVFLL